MEKTMNIFQQYLSYGLSCIPVKDKVCQLKGWKDYQARIPTFQEADRWGGDVALICGKVSGGLVCVDFDVKNGNKYIDFCSIIAEHRPKILSKFVVEITPSTGYHVVFKTGTIIKNVKLANNPEGKATIETRGEGGYFVCAPSQNYLLDYSDFGHIQTLNCEETEYVLNVCISLNEKVEEVRQPVNITQNSTGLTPFDDYDQRCDIVSVLTKHGWQYLFDRNGATYLQRPGKTGKGISATWNRIHGRLYIFTTSTQFENQKIYKASAVYTILEHGGNYSNAAKELYAQGFGERAKPKEPEKKEEVIFIALKDEMQKRILNIYNKGFEKGASTGWKSLDKCYRPIKGQFTVVTGMPSHGKSQFLDALTINLAAFEQWKFAIFSPENYPIEIHYQQLMEKMIGSPFFGDDRMNNEQVEQAANFVNDHYTFIDAGENELPFESLMEQCQKLVDEKHIDGVCFDPWNEIEMNKPRDLSSTEYIGKCLRIFRKFCRRNKVHGWIAVHPTKMQKDKDGVYPVPELYDCEGSAMWRNKADNGICVHRNFEEEYTDVHIQKIKYRYAGSPGTVKFKFCQLNGRYQEYDGF
jgi:hypothetical protein